MKRISRMAAVIGFLAILAMPPFSVATASDGLGSNEELSKCLNDGDRGLAVLFLVDTSQSLKKKDPRNERVEALQGALRALDSVADSQQIHVEFLDFGSKAERSFPDLSPWSDYDEVKSGLPERVKEYEDRNTAEDTDYADALQKAAETFDGAPDGECQLLAWFTDGALDIDFFDTPKTLDWATPPFEVNSEADQDEGKKKAKEAICDPEGFADNLRPPVDGDLTDGGAFIAAVPFVDGNEKDFDFLNKVVMNPDEDCGERPASGSMVLTEDFDQLTSALIRGVDPAPSAATVDNVPLESNELCSAPLNPDSPGAFNLPSSVESIRMRTETPSTKVVPVLLGPFGDDVDPLRFDKPGTKDVADGALVSISKLSPLMTNVDFVLPETVGAWSGVWELRFCAEPDQIPGSGTVEVLEVAGTVGAKLITENPVIRGEAGTATIQLVGGDKQRLRSDALGATDWVLAASDDIELRDKTLQDNGTIRSEFDVPADFESDQMVLDLELAPAVEVFPPEKIWPIDIGNIELGAIEIKDPPDYPTIGEPKVSFGVLDQENLKAEISLPVMANGPDSGGSVGLKEATVEGPGDPSYYTIVVTIDDIERQANDRVPFKAGDKGDIKVEIEIDEAAARIDGDVEVDLIFVSTSEKDPDQSGEFSFSRAAAVVPIFNTEAPDAGTLTGLLLLALLTPLLGLYAYNYFFGSRIDVVPSPVASIPVRITGANVQRTDNPADDRPVIHDADIKAWPKDKRPTKSVDVVGANGQQFEITAHASRLWWRSPYARAIGAGRDINIGPLGSDRKYRRARIPMSTAGLWVYSGDVPEEITQEPATDPIRVSQGVIVVFPSQSRTVMHANELLKAALDSVTAHMGDAEMPVQRDEAVTDSEPDNQYLASDGTTGSSSDDPTSFGGQRSPWPDTSAPPSDELPY